MKVVLCNTVKRRPQTVPKYIKFSPVVRSTVSYYTVYEGIYTNTVQNPSVNTRAWSYLLHIFHKCSALNSRTPYFNGGTDSTCRPGIRIS